MKNLIYSFIAIALLNSKVDAQQNQTSIAAPALVKTSDESGDFNRVEFGVRYLPTFTVFKFNTSEGNTVQGNVKISHGFGALLGVNITKHVGVQVEANYYKVSQVYKDQALDRKIEIKYLNIPVLLKLNTNVSNHLNLNVVAGPQFGLNVGSNINSTGSGNGDTLQAVLAVKKGDFGVAYGAGLGIALNEGQNFRLDVGYRGFYGLTSVSDNSTKEGTFSVIQKVNRKTNGAYVGITLLF